MKVVCILIPAFSVANGCFAAPASRATSAVGPPNGVLILADDLGFSDLGC